MTSSPLPGLPCKHILCWVGSAEERDPVVEVARALARQANGRSLVVMGLESGGRQQSGGPPVQAPLTPEVIIRAERRLSRLYGEGVDTMVLPGHPVLEVRRYARNHAVDLIVMGEQGSDLEHKYGVRMADQAPCAVMVLLPKRSEGPSTRDRATLSKE